MNHGTRWMAGLAIALVACSAPATEQPRGGSGEGESSSSAGVSSSSRRCDGGDCIPLGGSCGISASEPTGPCCDPAARCIEYTVYDYARCRVPSPAGAYCYRDDQCASGVCDGASSSCSP